MKSVMAALAAVAEAVGNLRALFPAGSDIVDEVAQAVTAVSDHVLEAAMLGEIGSAERGGPSPREFTEDEQKRLREIVGEIKAPAATPPHPKADKPKAKRAYVRKDKLGEPTGAAVPEQKPAADPKADKPTPLCVDCNGPYARTGNSQKRCPECAEARQKRQKAAWMENKRADDKNPAATADRLAAIKAANERLDRIPEPGD